MNLMDIPYVKRDFFIHTIAETARQFAEAVYEEEERYANESRG
jgi:hypothetical protein